MIGIDSILTIGSQLIDRLWPDPSEAAKAKAQLLEMQQRGELAQLDAALKSDIAQSEVNKAEADSTLWWVAGWRPAIGWVAAAAIGYSYVVHPLLRTLFALWWPGTPLPQLDLTELWPLIMGMLGLGGMRSWEKTKGVAK